MAAGPARASRTRASRRRRTSGVVQAKLREFGGDEIITGIGTTGVVGVIRGRAARTGAIGLRADMDALPIPEADRPAAMPRRSRA